MTRAMRRLVFLAAFALLLAASAWAQKQDSDDIHLASLRKACSAANPPPCIATPPKPIHQPDAKYSSKARDRKLEGVVILYLVVGTDGRPHNIRVARSLGYGLDEEAVKALNKWTFRPALDDQGRPVPVAINVLVNFRLY